MKPNSICKLLLHLVGRDTQRFRLTGWGLIDQMRRMATKDVTLDEGITIRRGELIVVDASRMKDPKIHKDVDRYDINRFRSMREDPGKTHKAQLVATSPDHLPRHGRGKSAPPRRSKYPLATGSTHARGGSLLPTR